uniref:Uncharacterized protein n=1 Tax=Coccidioides posadasii RMSCC 3488 TaxID=454284 RepID=A0A0J6FJQ1_COCPO|nr:hypothetical protein CPAG_05397 [Coccidioides posadasii RMSCC 3488]
MPSNNNLMEGETTMRPLDKQNNPPNKPFTPSMSAAFNRTAKAPLTPKLAGYNSTHSNRKFQHADAPIPNTSRSSENTSYVSGGLNSNITPRSGSRNSRRDALSASSSPSGTPSHAQNSIRSNVGHSSENPLTPRDNIGPSSRSSRPKSIVNGLLHSNPPSRPVSSCSGSLGAPMFFHADDTRSTISSHEADPKQSHGNIQPNGRYFTYANGVAEGSRSSSDRRPGPTKGKTQSGGVPTALRSPIASPRLQNAQPLLSSPKEPTTHPRESKRSSLHSSHPQEPPLLQTPRLNPTSPGSRSHCSHVKSPSIDGSQCFRQTRPHITSPTSHPILVAGDHGNASSPYHSPLPDSNRSSTSGDILHPFPRIGSPSKEDSNNNLQNANELAANARTERKVLDLEISNSSLLAINRTLEREMRKQNAELRRYRRLSRAGRLSITPSHHPVSGGGLSIVSETDNGAGDESFNSLNYITSESENGASSSEDETRSPDGGVESEEQPHARDEKHLLDDLARHQQLLINSQKLSQSIGRCLEWTESLITEGRKALEYQVYISDIEIGGRVLAHDDIDEDWQGGKALLSSTAEVPGFLDEHIVDDTVLANLPLSDGDVHEG